MTRCICSQFPVFPCFIFSEDETVNTELIDKIYEPRSSHMVSQPAPMIQTLLVPLAKTRAMVSMDMR